MTCECFHVRGTRLRRFYINSVVTKTVKSGERLTITRNALHMGINISDTSKLTGLTEDEIRKLAH